MARKLLKGHRLYRLVLFLAVLGIILIMLQIYYARSLGGGTEDGENKIQDKMEHELKDRGRGNNHRHEFAQEDLKLEIPVKQKSDSGINLSLGKSHGDTKVQLNNIRNDEQLKSTKLKISASNEVVEMHNPRHRLNTSKQSESAKEKSADDVVPVHGVPRHLLHLYQVQNGEFTCINNKERISSEKVNDDYCDCSDSSDEPGTSACPDGKFYCSFQLAGSSSIKSLPSSRVNDGVCDCCDGSDELNKKQCPDTCHNLRQAWQQNLNKQKEGALLKQQKYLPDAMNSEYGAFDVLKQKCFDHNSDKYIYKVCPFVEVRQVDGSIEKVIGREPKWLSKDPWKLEMSRGDSTQCPMGNRRLSIVMFECGLHDKVLSIQESQVCEYTIVFSTPAAC